MDCPLDVVFVSVLICTTAGVAISETDTKSNATGASDIFSVNVNLAFWWRLKRSDVPFSENNWLKPNAIRPPKVPIAINTNTFLKLILFVLIPYFLVIIQLTNFIPK
jgi:hypothetical protein